MQKTRRIEHGLGVESNTTSEYIAFIFILQDLD